MVTLAEQLRDQRHVPEVVLSETSAAMAVLASHRKYHFCTRIFKHSVDNHFVYFYTALARRQIMDLFSGNFYKVLIRLTDSPYKEVQYNCAGVIGHLAINGNIIHMMSSIFSIQCSIARTFSIMS